MQQISQKMRNLAGVHQSRGLYDPRFEHDSCGVGFVSYLDAEPRHSVITEGLQVLSNMQHRGAVGGDSKTGDGAGLMIQIPDQLFRERLSLQLPAAGDYSVGMVFLPVERTEEYVKLLEEAIEEENHILLGWRDVPVCNESLGELAASTEPVIKQFFLDRDGYDISQYQQRLYILRRRMEKKVSLEKGDHSQFYICSLSHTNVIYKGLFTGDQVEAFYQDLQDEMCSSSFAIVHSRFSTNTLPEWRLAQPFRFLAHNGEINTIQGNINRQKAREGFMSSSVLGKQIEKIVPVIDETGSDSAIFDNVMELFHMAGRSIPHVMMMMIPEAYSPEILMSEDKKAFYEYHSIIMEPWDGPAAVVFTDGRYIGATLDRNGLRPARYTITHEGLIVLASETGVLNIPQDRVRTKGRLQPGKMFLVDLHQHRIVPDNEIKAKISREYPYRRWVKKRKIELRGLFMPSGVPKMDKKELIVKQTVFGYTDEDLKTLIIPMAKQGQEAIGSMGNDTGLPVLSDNSHLLFSYFRQLFAQVTNPPIDPLREQLVMSLESYIENESNPLDSGSTQCRALKLSHPLLSIRDMVRIRNNTHPDLKSAELDMTFIPDETGEGLRTALQEMYIKAERLASEGYSLMILSDRQTDRSRAPIPSLLAASGLHHYMIRKRMRGKIGIIVETGEAREVFHYALYLAYGVDAVCPYIAFHTVRDLAEQNRLGDISPDIASDNYVNAVKKGLLKSFSRMGISTLHSFFGTQIFEAVGLGKDLVDEYFTGTVSRIGGIGFKELSREAAMRMKKAFPPREASPKFLEAGGLYRFRRQGEKHYWSPQSIYKLQQAARNDDYGVFKEFTTLMNNYYRENAELRGLMKFKKRKSIPIEEVEPVEEITKRFVTAAMSIGSISREAHETVALAMNRLGAKSNSGEGGEDPLRYKPMENGDSKRSRIKQIASGRFGVTTEYIMSADELQIKMAQGAKPGEGGQLPGHKVTEYIAKIRHTTPGVTLISPPPHHDIYSIEDLAQLINDLKTVNDTAEVSVKLVSEPGVGTIASGVAKAKADRVLISGQNGGTGASPLTAIRHAGLPWELGLAETQQSLIINKLRDRIILQVDGHLKTGKDLAIATLLGAEEYGFGTSVLICLGCVMMRKCHVNTCPVGVATQDPELRKRFMGQAVYVERFLRYAAQEFREIMAELGFRKVSEMVGRVDCLDFQPAVEHWKANNLNLQSILNKDHLADNFPLHHTKAQERPEKNQLDRELDKKLKNFWKSAAAAMDKDAKVDTAEKAGAHGEFPEPVSCTCSITNRDRAVGAAISGRIVKLFGQDVLPDNSVSLHLRGSAGQSF
ncbi:MAG: glutamate synthase large subunit, partial [Spirochaetales bacterium]|nr:glutamate synthase large subunit [Spirochaetales bacterium]